MKKIMIARLLLLLVPWLSAPFLSKKDWQRYTPVAGFAAALVAGMCVLAVPYKWWTVGGRWKEKVLNDGSFIMGPFFIGTIWIFRYTFGDIKRYMAANLVMDVLFSYPLNTVFQRLGFYRLLRFKPRYILLFFTCYSFLIYGFQMWREQSMYSKADTGR
ncbi:hypothetical protein [Ectobacillus ponti]|uniref:Uncharacterized protein n=1 Tax=Ectobacillus ponti TaxID=2961894 RepID=A0AA41X6Y7_9BACI|nr:hypothetical protein [Ectobacillus ponti]MCP8969962.1 hypothetical protein [Ectobacillus ponti]